jgi:hypothetical protein
VYKKVCFICGRGGFEGSEIAAIWRRKEAQNVTQNYLRGC